MHNHLMDQTPQISGKMYRLPVRQWGHWWRLLTAAWGAGWASAAMVLPRSRARERPGAAPADPPGQFRKKYSATAEF